MCLVGHGTGSCIKISGNVDKMNMCPLCLDSGSCINIGDKDDEVLTSQFCHCSSCVNVSTPAIRCDYSDLA